MKFKVRCDRMKRAGEENMAYGKSIELFLVNGSPDSIITAELSNWNGKAIKIPRIDVPSCTRNDIMQAGVYFLFCKEDDGTEAVYIGEAENEKKDLYSISVIIKPKKKSITGLQL